MTLPTDLDLPPSGELAEDDVAGTPEDDELAASIVVTEPGVYLDMPEAVYHADPVPEGSLSCSGARKLLPPSCPALFDYARTHRRPEKRAFDFGHAAHALVLGVGMDVEVIDADNYRTNAAKEARDAAYARGAAPLLRGEWATVQAMAERLGEHPIASALLKPGAGAPEASLFWRDERTLIMRRARLDWLPNASGGRLIVPDYKTADSANPETFGRQAWNFGYCMQDPWYLDGVTALGLAEQAAFVFVVQEKTPPYLVSVVELDTTARRIGRERNRRAIDTYVECSTADYWPGYSDSVVSVALPGWAEYLGESE